MKRVVVRILLAGVASAIGVLCILRLYLWRQEVARARWARAAIQEIADSGLTGEEIRTEVNVLRSEFATNAEASWTGDQVICMTNSEYLVYRYQHGSSTGSRAHLFVARSSDARWWFSSYHFCNRLAMVAHNTASPSISSFAEDYYLKEFDGDYRHALSQTWSGGIRSR